MSTKTEYPIYTHESGAYLPITFVEDPWKDDSQVPFVCMGVQATVGKWGTANGVTNYNLLGGKTLQFDNGHYVKKCWKKDATMKPADYEWKSLNDVENGKNTVWREGAEESLGIFQLPIHDDQLVWTNGGYTAPLTGERTKTAIGVIVDKRFDEKEKRGRLHAEFKKKVRTNMQTYMSKYRKTKKHDWDGRIEMMDLVWVDFHKLLDSVKELDPKDQKPTRLFTIDGLEVCTYLDPWVVYLLREKTVQDQLNELVRKIHVVL